MVETLDVSKLSGWLNADARCRVEREASEEGRHAGREVAGRGAAAAQAACREDPTVEAAGRARAEPTKNISRMFVTLDVSKLSGWLNTDASCRVRREAWQEGQHAGREAGGGGVAGAGQAARRQDPTVVGCWQGTRGAHEKHLKHVCDARRVEGQRLVERRRFLRSRKEGIGRGATCRPGGGSAWGGASSAHRGPNCGGLLAGQARSAPETSAAWL